MHSYSVTEVGGGGSSTSAIHENIGNVIILSGRLFKSITIHFKVFF